MYIYKHKQKNPNQSTNKHQNIKLFFISLKKIQGLLPIVSQHSEHVRLMTQLHISQISQCKGSQAVKETLIPKATLIFLNHETIKSLLIKQTFLQLVEGNGCQWIMCTRTVETDLTPQATGYFWSMFQIKGTPSFTSIRGRSSWQIY